MNKFGEVTQASVRPTPLTLPHNMCGALAVSNMYVVSIQRTNLPTHQVLPNCYLWVEKETGKRHKVLKLPPSTNGVSVNKLSLVLHRVSWLMQDSSSE